VPRRVTHVCALLSRCMLSTASLHTHLLPQACCRLTGASSSAAVWYRYGCCSPWVQHSAADRVGSVVSSWCCCCKLLAPTPAQPPSTHTDDPGAHAVKLQARQTYRHTTDVNKTLLLYGQSAQERLVEQVTRQELRQQSCVVSCKYAGSQTYGRHSSVESSTRKCV
jgi:hypothetical protein